MNKVLFFIKKNYYYYYYYYYFNLFLFLLNVVASLRRLITVDSCAPLRQVGTFLETAHLPLPKANINTYFSLRAKCWIRGGVGGQFPLSV